MVMMNYDGWKHRGCTVAIGGCIGLLLVLGGYAALKYRWKGYLEPVARIVPYVVGGQTDDTLRVLMIGDSWAGMHHEQHRDADMQARLQQLVAPLPVIFAASGRGGAKSGDVYKLMFRDVAEREPLLQGYSTQQLLQQAPHYCIVMAGINDAGAYLGAENYCQNYLLIVRTLLGWGIRPVVVEMPPVGLEELYSGKPMKDRAVDFVRSMMTGSRSRDVGLYAEALLHSLVTEGLHDSVLVVRKEMWNEHGYKDVRRLYLADGIHLNGQGYVLLDSCIAAVIAQDVQKRWRMPSTTEAIESCQTGGEGGCRQGYRKR